VEATLAKQASQGPPARVRHLFTTLDVDNRGALSMDEVKAGFAKHFKVDKLAPHVLAKIDEIFEKVAKVDDKGEHVLGKGSFQRFYCEVLFRHFDADDSGTLELDEFQKALAHMVKPNADGSKTMPAIAFPPETRTESGEVHLPVAWFWKMFSSME